MRAVWLTLCLLFVLPCWGEEATVPDPLTLEKGWWSYFDEGPLEERIARFDGRLAELEAELAVEQREKLQSALSRIRLNFTALPASLETSTSEPPVKRPLKESYSIEELLTLVREVDGHKEQLTEQEEDVEAARRASNTGLAQIDALFLTYAGLDEATEKRLEVGLEIINKRVALEVTRNQIDLQENAIEVLKSLLADREDELEGASDRLAGSEELSFLYEGQRAKAVAEADQADNRILQLESAMLGSFVNGEYARSTQAHLGQQVVQAEVDKGRAGAEVIKYDLLHTLNQLLLNPSDEGIEDWLGAYEEQQEELEKLLYSIEEWKWATARESAKAGDGFARTSNGDANGDPTLRSLFRSRLDTAQETMAGIRSLETVLAELVILEQMMEERFLEQRSRISQALFYGWELIRVGLKNLLEAGRWSLFRIGEVSVTPFGVFRSLLIIVVGFWLSGLVQRTIQTVGAGHRRTTTANLYVVGRLAHYSILSLALVLALASLGLDFSNLALVAGALSVGIGFGLQTIVSNFFSGLIILFEGNLKVGDFLELESGPRGRITSINVRSTIIRTNDGIEVMIPNAEIIGNRVTNWTMSDVHRRMHIPFGVAYDTDKELVVKAVMEAVGRVDCTIRDHNRYADPKVNMTGFGDNSLNFELVVWVDRQASKRHRGTLSTYLWEIHSSFAEHGIDIPFPQRDLYVKEFPAATKGK